MAKAFLCHTAVVASPNRTPALPLSVWLAGNGGGWAARQAEQNLQLLQVQVGAGRPVVWLPGIGMRATG